MTIRRVVPLAFAVASVTVLASAQDEPSAAIVSWKADKVMQPAEGVLEATGDVELAMGRGLQLRADSVTVRKGAEGQRVAEITAVGNVELSRGQERFHFHRLVFDPSTGQGTFELSTESE
jgi:lipopolysaccharide export system protein LptA